MVIASGIGRDSDLAGGFGRSLRDRSLPDRLGMSIPTSVRAAASGGGGGAGGGGPDDPDDPDGPDGPDGPCGPIAPGGPCVGFRRSCINAIS